MTGPGTGLDRLTGSGTGLARVTGPRGGLAPMTGPGGLARMTGSGNGLARVTGPGGLARMTGSGNGLARMTGSGNGLDRMTGPGGGLGRATRSGNGLDRVTGLGGGKVIATKVEDRTEGPTWVGVLDLDVDGPVTGVSGALQDHHCAAQLLVRKHGAPLGFVAVPPQPVETLTDRARAAAFATLPGELARHAACEVESDPDRLGDWTAQTSCPLRFPVASAVGVTVAIPTRNRAELLRDCLLRIMQLSYAPLEILIVDNAPSDQSTRDLVLELASRDPRLTYTCEHARGASAARNHALATARYDIVALTDDDVLVDPGWVTALVAGFASDPDVTCVTGLVAPSALDNPFQRYFEGRYPNQGILRPRRYDMSTYRLPSPLYPFAAGLFGRSANMAVRRSSAREIGGFDPLLGAGAPCLGGEDLDFFVRLLLNGGRICFMPSALVWHRHRENADKLRNIIYIYGYGLGAYLSKHASKLGLRRALITHAVRQGGLQARRMRVASHSSQLGIAGNRLAISEARGVLAGALGYRRVRRRLASQSVDPR